MSPRGRLQLAREFGDHAGSLGDPHHFGVVVASGTVGHAKPHPQIFRIASERLGVDVEAALYVGDSVEYDVAGAGAAGMDVVLVDREDEHEAEPRIRTLSQLAISSNEIDGRQAGSDAGFRGGGL